MFTIDYEKRPGTSEFLSHDRIRLALKEQEMSNRYVFHHISTTEMKRRQDELTRKFEELDIKEKEVMMLSEQLNARSQQLDTREHQIETYLKDLHSKEQHIETQLHNLDVREQMLTLREVKFLERERNNPKSPQIQDVTMQEMSIIDSQLLRRAVFASPSTPNDVTMHSCSKIVNFMASPSPELSELFNSEKSFLDSPLTTKTVKSNSKVEMSKMKQLVSADSHLIETGPKVTQRKSLAHLMAARAISEAPRTRKILSNHNENTNLLTRGNINENNSRQSFSNGSGNTNSKILNGVDENTSSKFLDINENDSLKTVSNRNEKTRLLSPPSSAGHGFKNISPIVKTRRASPLDRLPKPMRRY